MVTMLLEIQDIAGHEKETLFIIGNGFDRAHGLLTSYSNFYDWLTKYHQEFVDSIMSLFPHHTSGVLSDEDKRKSLLWTDFENALAKIDADSSLNYLQQTFGDVYSDMEALSSSIVKVKSIVSDIFVLMLEWSRNTDISSVHRLYYMTNDSKYLTFNYTQTLEECYKIHSSQILHIHGNVNDDHIDVGCERDTMRHLDNANQGRRKYSKEINSVLGELNKPVDEILERNNNFFASLNTIDRVVVIGHSLSDIDIPYLRVVRDNVDKKAHWHFSAFSNEDHARIAKFIQSDLGGLEQLIENRHYIFNVRLKDENAANDYENKAKLPYMPSKAK